MSTLAIVVPFPDAGRLAGVWAAEEAAIDFRREPERAARCTAAFAAGELRDHLLPILPGWAITCAERDPGQGAVIELALDAAGLIGGDTFALEPMARGVRIRGAGRLGLMLGAYELLRRQGWRWYAPGKDGACAPAPLAAPAFPAQRIEGRPSFTHVRGFDIEAHGRENADLVLWMARNRMNMVGDRPGIRPLARKLGLTLQAGGHIFERILDPDRPLPSGRSLWQDHQAWFGLPSGGTRTKALAQKTQFCVSDQGLQAFLADGLLEWVQGAWSAADIVYVWGFDTWGECCHCPGCTRLGNGADQILHLFAALRGHLDRARGDGRLDHDLRLGLCLYEGTATLDAPLHGVPESLRRAGDYGVYYPINRCYAHPFADSACAVNERYHRALQGQLAVAPRLELSVGEYWNVSKFDDLPLVFTRRQAEDLRTYHALGASGMTYMHVPLVNWAVRAATQGLYAQLAWDVGSDADGWMDEYCARWYGSHATAMRNVYRILEQAQAEVADWRAWAQRSVLTRLLAWDGARPSEELATATHFGSAATAIAAGRASLARLSEAQALVAGCLAREREQAPEDDRIERRLSEDRRCIQWGIDCLALTVAVTAYHEALRTGAPTDGPWDEVEAIADRCDRYHVGLTYLPTPGVVLPDALTRSQLRDVIRRARRARTQGR